MWGRGIGRWVRDWWGNRPWVVGEWRRDGGGVLGGGIVESVEIVWTAFCSC
jgi:hypothetical protein